jgi:hypothetical protein
MPQFSYPIYAVRPTNSDDFALAPVLAALRSVTASASS